MRPRPHRPAYVHGLFGSPTVVDAVRQALQQRRGWETHPPTSAEDRESSLAAWFRAGADVERILAMVRA